MLTTQDKSALQLGSPRCENIQINVEMFSGKTLALVVHASDTVSNVKAAISDTEHISAEAHYLVFAGKALQNDHTLSECNVRPQSLLRLVQCFPGGMQIDVPTRKGKKTVDLNGELDLSGEFPRSTDNPEYPC